MSPNEVTHICRGTLCMTPFISRQEWRDVVISEET